MPKEIALQEEKIKFESGRTEDLGGIFSAVRTVMNEELTEVETKSRQRADKISDRVKKVEETLPTLITAVTSAMTQSQAGNVVTSGRTRAKQDVAPYIRGFFANVLRKPDIKDGECDATAHAEYSAAWGEFLRRGDHANAGRIQSGHASRIRSGRGLLGAR